MARATAFAIEPLLASVRPGMRVLDVGCGPGTLTAAAAERGAVVTGVDLADGMLAEARRRHPHARRSSRLTPRTCPFADRRVRRRAGRVPGQPHAGREAARSPSCEAVARRVALAAWGPEDAGRVPRAARPRRAGPRRRARRPGLRALRRPGAARRARRRHGRDDSHRAARRCASTRSTHSGTASAAARSAPPPGSSAATDEQRAAARDELTRLAEPYRDAHRLRAAGHVLVAANLTGPGPVNLRDGSPGVVLARPA